MSSVATPMGTALFFCDSGRERHWLDDFSPRGHRLVGLAAAGIDPRVDHGVDRRLRSVGAVLPMVLGLAGRVRGAHRSLRSHPQLAATDPSGRVHALAPHRCGTRQAPGDRARSSSPSTDDAVACAQALRDLGAPLLKSRGTTTTTSMPGFPAGRTSTAFGEDSILYDRDERGEFLHFFTEMLGSRVFFEVVNGVNGYDAFGDPHSVPLRMAAHRRQRLRMLASAPSGSLERTPARLLARPPDRAEPVTAGAGGCRRRRGLPVWASG